MRSLLFLLLTGIAPEALAWGLQTHLYLAQHALPAVPQLHAGLVLAGACLPDLLLAGRVLGTPAFARSHRWSTLRRLAAAPRDEGERALALGYATHLLADVVAHHTFVPEHEERIARIPYFTHALAEWAMDEHIRVHLKMNPREVLVAEERAIVAFVARHFHCGDALALRAVRWLAGADGWLRASRVPALCLRLLGPAQFDAYLVTATGALDGLEPALQGRLTDWINSNPEGGAGDRAADHRAGEHVARIV